MTSGASEQTAENISASLVGGDNPVTDKEGSAAYMVGDYSYGDIFFRIICIVYTGGFANGVKDFAYGIHLKEIVNVLYDTGQTLKSHAGIYVFAAELGIVAGAVIVKLGETLFQISKKRSQSQPGAQSGSATHFFSPVK